MRSSQTAPRIQIDLNARAGGVLVPALIVEAMPPVHVGAPVMVFEPEDELIAYALVREVHEDAGIILLEVDWSTLQDDPALNPQVVIGSSRVSSNTSFSFVGEIARRLVFNGNSVLGEGSNTPGGLVIA